MLSEEELKFIDYWQQNRVREGKWQVQLLTGLPVSLLVFGLPLLFNFLFGRLWYKRLPYVSPGDVNFILLAALVIVIFFSMFRKRFRWEQYEQRYLELLSKQKKSIPS
jgi:hypothetical protein